MQKIACLIIEDEPLAAEILEEYISQMPSLHLANICSDAIQAIDILKNTPVDIIFLDIHLPKLKGLDFIRAIDFPPKIIITSAYQEYALQGYELNVVDYLLKPIEFKRFVVAANKACQQISDSRVKNNKLLTAERDYLFFNVGKKKEKIVIEEILYIESLREYIKIVTKDRSILTKLSLNLIEEYLLNRNMLRIHRSFIVAMDKIDAFSATDVEIKGKLIPIGRSYKDLVYSHLESFN
ncbi:LytR/AlgR family response regulator transcription factor [Spirosoma radiotolerans]|uniref:Chemotaxis protein CheY n=1 Tax=Spirosoma radiotolerans TaxID=1379870 RepID=A0A0E3V538_9BACT|nr:response regulator transcription factor [Spirosoma radiotolerans]AKD53847.1 chemotaxis protein CheY [Spirosoma radiotolerans]